MFTGRERELSLLESLWNKSTASFVVCRGRRRIGKSTLIQKFAAKADRFLEFQGLPPGEYAKNNVQMAGFVEQLCEKTEIPHFQPETWEQIFSFLVMGLNQNERTVILLDEISWMASGEKNFPGWLKIAWDTKFKHFSNLILIVCGSVTSWIDENILNNTGFMGRISLELMPMELSLFHCNQFWQEKKNRISSMEKLKLLSITGGVPRYLEEIDINLPAEKNIKNICFSKEGFLFHEFERIFNDIFKRKAKSYKKIILSLVNGAKTFSEIINLATLKKSGNISKYLEDLVISGFLAKDTSYSPITGNASKLVKFRLKDNYLRFYLKYIEPLREKINSGLFDDTELVNILNWETVIGLQFENLVLNNRKNIIRQLNISSASLLSASPYYQRKTKQHPGCQIDLLIQTKYSIYPCEIKFRKKITHSVIEEVSQKIKALSIPGILSIRPVLIYEGELAQSVVQSDFFGQIIPFADLLTSQGGKTL